MEMGIRVDSPDDEQVPRMMTRNMDRNRLKMSYCNFGHSVSAKRKNSKVAICFTAFVLLINLMGRMR
jgi:hypothetical protein